MSFDVDGIAFDLDGTLYPNHRLYIRLLSFILKEGRLLQAMGKARHRLRRQPPEIPPGTMGFYDEQARLMAETLGEEPGAVKERAERLIYRGWEPLFKRIDAYAGALQTLKELRARGLKLGLLSDFPPAIKLAHMRLDGLWDTLLCSEVLGKLKPDPAPFRVLAEKMELSPERILYVGNSVPYDIAGAKRAGMKAALIRPGWAIWRKGGADFVFSSYRQLSAFVLI